MAEGERSTKSTSSAMIAEAVAQREADYLRRQEAVAEQAKKVNAMPSRVNIVEDDEGRELVIAPRPFWKFVADHGSIPLFSAAFMATFVTGIIAGITYILFIQLMDPFIGMLLAVGFGLGTFAIFFWAIIRVRNPPIHVRVSAKSDVLIYGRNPQRHIAVGRVQELRASATVDEQAPQWAELWVWLDAGMEQPYVVRKLSHKDAESVNEFLAAAEVPEFSSRRMAAAPATAKPATPPA